ncbi:MAG: hypothetical protein ACLTSZ_17225 [Lachnospiraceae bacterium]
MPDGCSGLLIGGGGYPELYAEALSENKSGCWRLSAGRSRAACPTWQSAEDSHLY